MQTSTLDQVGFLDSRQFQIVMRRLADNLSYGSDRSPFLGSGIEFAQSRQYEHGDPVRDLDWRVIARTGKAYIKEYEAPKCMPVYLLIDTSASMTLSSVPSGKYPTAMILAGGIALAALDRVSPVGVLGVGTRRLQVRPSLSKAQIMQWMLTLRRFRHDEGTTLTQRLGELMPSLTSRVLLLVISDLHDPGAVNSLKRAAQLHDCAVLQMQDPAEEGLAGAGFMRAQEAESGQPFSTHGRRQHLDQEQLETQLRRAGIDHHRVLCGQPYLAGVRHFFASRGLLGRTAR